MITVDAVDDLGIKQGDQVSVVIKSPEVALRPVARRAMATPSPLASPQAPPRVRKGTASKAAAP
jgi:hypothetical protein